MKGWVQVVLKKDDGWGRLRQNQQRPAEAIKTVASMLPCEGRQWGDCDIDDGEEEVVEVDDNDETTTISAPPPPATTDPSPPRWIHPPPPIGDSRTCWETTLIGSNKQMTSRSVQDTRESKKEWY